MFDITLDGFKNAPISRFLVVSAVFLSIIISIFNFKSFSGLALDPHISSYHQWWRIALWQTAYLNSSEAILYIIISFSVSKWVERFWSSRQYLTFIISAWLCTTLIVSGIYFTLFNLKENVLNYIPPGCTPVLFATLYQYYRLIPSTYWFDISLGTKILPMKLAIINFPGSLIQAIIGWIFGYFWTIRLCPRFWRDSRVPRFLEEFISSSSQSAIAIHGAQNLDLNETEPAYSGSVFTTLSGASERPELGQVREQDVQSIMSILEIDRTRAITALQQANNNVEGAIGLLLG